MRFLKCKFDADIPTILHVYRESRVEGLKSYTLRYKEDSYVVSENPIYCDFKLDVLHLTRYHSRKHMERFISRSAQSTLENIGNLYMTYGCWDQFTPVTDRPTMDLQIQKPGPAHTPPATPRSQRPFQTSMQLQWQRLPKSFLESAEMITTKEKEQIHRNCGAWLLAVKYHVEEIRIRKGKNVSP